MTDQLDAVETAISTMTTVLTAWKTEQLTKLDAIHAKLNQILVQLGGG